MFLEPDSDDAVDVVRALLQELITTSPPVADLLHHAGTILLDGANDRVVFQLPADALAQVLANRAWSQALARGVAAVLGRRVGAYLHDPDSPEPPTALSEDDDGAGPAVYDDASVDLRSRRPGAQEEEPAMADVPTDPSPLSPDLPRGSEGQPTQSPFERIKRVGDDGAEFWSSRELGPMLGYDSYRNFENAITKAKDACENSGHPVTEHFLHATEAVAIGKGASRKVDVVYLSRYACYLVIQNADPRKPMVALGQSYFTVQTRRQELADAALEDSLRVKLREEIKVHNKQVAAAAYAAGVRTPMDYAVFNDHGYKGLYNGIGAHQIREHRGLKRTQDILDFMGSTELAANLFRATQTEELLRRGGIRSKEQANVTHLQVGIRVREAMKDISGIMPEDLPVAENIKKVEKRLQKLKAQAGHLAPGASDGP